MSIQADSGPNLLLNWQEETGPVRWLRDGIASLAVHAVLVPLLVLVASMETPAPKLGTEIVSNVQHVTLIAPADLTQKAPNKAKVSKEVNVEDLMPRPASEQRLPPAPALRAFQPPTPKRPGPPVPGPNITEPPKLDAAVNPPQLLPAPAGTPQAPPPKIQSEEQPKLALETPGQRGPSPDESKGQSKLAPPKTTVAEALRQVERGGGNQGGIVIGDLEHPNVPELPQLPPSPGRIGSSLELMSDPMGVDFKPYLIQILARVRRNWFAVIPESARMGNRGLVQLQFMIDRSGQVPKLVIASTSGSQALDKAAVASISASVPFPPLPPEYKGLSIRLQFAFKYNVQ
ncbi:MAG TPA: TonB family protein [Bryobacteraceae bacterium]|nr:TonB family protein [Bryobacteraceae bacterium]